MNVNTALVRGGSTRSRNVDEGIIVVVDARCFLGQSKSY